MSTYICRTFCIYFLCILLRILESRQGSGTRALTTQQYTVARILQFINRVSPEMMVQSRISNKNVIYPIPSLNRTSSQKRYSLPEGSQRCLSYGVTRALKGDSRAPLVLYILTNDVTNDVICDVICESSNQMPERLHHTHVTCASLVIGCAPLPLVLKIALPPSYACSESRLVILLARASGKIPFATYSPTLKKGHVRMTCVF